MLGTNRAATDQAVELDDGLARHGLRIGDNHFALLFKLFRPTSVGGSGGGWRQPEVNFENVGE